MNKLILYTTEDGKSQIKLRTDRRTVWLSQQEMAELFDVSVENIGLHLKNIYQEGELVREATAEESSVVQFEGKREVRHKQMKKHTSALSFVQLRTGDEDRNAQATQTRAEALTFPVAGK